MAPDYVEPSSLSDPFEKYGYNDDRQENHFASYPSAARREQRRPLISYASNEWKNNPRAGSRSSPSAAPDRRDFLEATNRIPGFLRSRRLRRYALMWFVLVTITILSWHTWMGEAFMEDRRLMKSLSDTNRLTAGGWYGSNLKPTFPDMIQVEDLDTSLKPSSKRPKSGYPKKGSNRLIFVGDVHGCKDELVELLEVVKFNKKTDHLILLGDMVTKGPESLGVIDLASELGASCVRGNHEDRLLLIYKDFNSTILPFQGPSKQETEQENATTPSGHVKEESWSNGDEQDGDLAKHITPKQHTYLSSCPVILRVGVVGSLGEVVAVHAGLVPGVPLEHQDPISAMNMRSIDLDTHVPSKSPANGAENGRGKKQNKGLVNWTRLWNKYENLLPNPSRAWMRGDKTPKMHTTVIYGHDSHMGLQLRKWSKGLDTGCVKGGKLTALVVGDGGHTVLRRVQCKDYRPQKAKEEEVKDVSKDERVGGRSQEKMDTVGGKE